MSAINSPAKKEIGPWMFFIAPLGPLQNREEFISFIRRSSNKTRLKNEQRMFKTAGGMDVYFVLRYIKIFSSKNTSQLSI